MLHAHRRGGVVGEGGGREEAGGCVRVAEIQRNNGALHLVDKFAVDSSAHVRQLSKLVADGSKCIILLANVVVLL